LACAQLCGAGGAKVGMFMAIGAWFVDMSLAAPLDVTPSPPALGEAVMLTCAVIFRFRRAPLSA
jgi:hypothetical protein